MKGRDRSDSGNMATEQSTSRTSPILTMHKLVRVSLSVLSHFVSSFALTKCHHKMLALAVT